MVFGPPAAKSAGPKVRMPRDKPRDYGIALKISAT
jgi:hypothetical protein